MRTTATLFSDLRLDPQAPLPLFRQLYDALREWVLEGRLARGMRLPSTRALAHELGVSRNTVVGVFEQLTAEGYLEGQIGSGTYVASTLPETWLRVSEGSRPESVRVTGRRALSERGRMISAVEVTPSLRSPTPQPFRPGLPALDEFPYELWARMTARHHRRATQAMLSYGSPAGYTPLRKAVAEYVRSARGVRCSWEQVIITCGAQQGLDLTARLLLDPGEQAWMEDPGYRGALGALTAAGARIVPVPVDEEGLNVSNGVERAPGAKLAYISPSHQFPLGVTMSVSRRLAMLEWARSAGAWIVEDDYDSEYRYEGRPLASLQGLDTEGCVVYLGTFSKVLYPSLRLGYLIVPPSLIDPFTRARAVADRHSGTVEQVVLAEFIEEGHFGRHLRRMRSLYAERQEALRSAIFQHAGDRLRVGAQEAGLHLVGWLPVGMSDSDLARRSAELGLETPPLSQYCREQKLPPGLMLGYAGFSPSDLRGAIQKLSALL